MIVEIFKFRIGHGSGYAVGVLVRELPFSFYLDAISGAGKFMKKIVAVLAVLAFSSCATILEPGPDRIPVRSEPDGAKVLLNGMLVGVTPMLLNVNRADNCSLDLQKDGYQTIHLERDKVVAGWVFGNIILGGVIGLAVDLIAHNQGKYSEDPIFVTLPATSK
jgi:hypothetical protein